MGALFLPYFLSAQSIGVGVFKPEKAYPGYRLYYSEPLETAHLITPAGRYVHTWHYPQGRAWRYAELQSDGSLLVLTKDKRLLELDWNSQPLRRRLRKAPKKFIAESKKLVRKLPNGNNLISDSKHGRLFELTRRGELVWEYSNPDYDRFGQRMPLPRTHAYSRSWVDELLKTHGQVPDLSPEEEAQRQKRLEAFAPYKSLIRESIAEIEAGYWDDAFRYLRDFVAKHPDDPEGLYAMSLLYGLRRNFRPAMQHLQEAIAAGVPLQRFTLGLNGLFTPLLDSEPFRYYLAQQEEQKLVHGPMLGQLTDKSASFWVRTDGPATVAVKVRDAAGQRLITNSITVRSEPSQDFTATVKVNGLSPNTHYTYELWLDQRRVGETYRFRTAPLEGMRSRFSVGFSGGAGYNPDYERMWDSLANQDMQAFLLMGDNVYIDHPERPATQLYCYQRRQSRPEFRHFVSGTPIYAIWDDHDFGYNDSQGGPMKDTPAWKRDVWRRFQQQWINPAYGGGEGQPGCWFSFDIGEVAFFMLDGRYYREDPGRKGASMLGAAQKKWLLESLASSTATFKVIASPVPWADAAKPGSTDHWGGYVEEREELFSFIAENRIDGVVLLSGDQHRSDAWRIERPEGYALYDFSSSRLTNEATADLLPEALFGYNLRPAYGLLTFDTVGADPSVMYRIFNIENQEIHRLTLFKSQLSMPVPMLGE